MREATKNERIYRDIRARITTGVLRPGEQLATQQSLAGSYGVTVMTLRHALERLERDGLIEATQGRGTFVSTRPFQYRVNNLWSFAQQMREQGRALTTRLVSFSIAPLEVPDAEVRSRLALGPQSAVYLLERLRLVDGRPVLLQRSYLPLEVGRLLPGDQLDGPSLYDLLAEVEYEVVRAVETIRAVVPDEIDAAQLNLAPGSAAMLSVRLSLSAGDEPVLLDRALISGDACEVTAERSAEHTLVSYSLR